MAQLTVLRGAAPAGNGAGLCASGAPVAEPAEPRGRWAALNLVPDVSGGRDGWSEPLEEAPADGAAALLRVLDEVLDPELPVSVVELGLVCGVDFQDGAARVELTYTATACPCMDFIREDVTDRIEREPWVTSVEIDEVWDPPWTNARITEQGRRKLARLGVGAW